MWWPASEPTSHLIIETVTFFAKTKHNPYYKIAKNKEIKSCYRQDTTTLCAVSNPLSFQSFAGKKSRLAWEKMK